MWIRVRYSVRERVRLRVRGKG
jgi:hypothetical protein